MEITRDIIERETERFLREGGTIKKLKHVSKHLEYDNLIEREAAFTDDVRSMVFRSVSIVVHTKIF